MARTLWILALAGLGGCGGCNGTEPGEQTVTTPTEEALTSGRVVLHRLNRAEYNNTVQDLLGVTSTPADDFPYDDSSHGFDNIAATLTMSPLHVELYERAAESLALEVMKIPITEPITWHWEAEGPDVTATVGGTWSDFWSLWSNGDLSAVVEVPEEGEYLIRARVWGDQAGPDLVEAGLSHDGILDATFTITGTNSNEAEIIEVPVQLNAGTHIAAVSFFNDYWNPDYGLDRNLAVDWLEVEGPMDASPEPNALREAMLICDPDEIGQRACAKLVMENFVPRAWRRPVTAEEIDHIMGLYDIVVEDDGTFDDGVTVCIQSVLLSPHFLFRVEVQPEPDTTTMQPLSDYEIANRLSYMLWSTMPDQALFQAAENGDLQDPDLIADQVRRMLADPKAEALVDNFAGQWLYIRNIDLKTPDPFAFPDFDEDLRVSMKEEISRFFETFIGSERDLRELLTATESAIDTRLADHYGISDVSEWETVDLTAIERGGLFGMSGLHMVNSYPARTSPVLRGKWVLGQLLCEEPPPPPPGVEGLVEDDANAQTIREQLEQHRADPTCAACHAAMDPIGLAMEHFDGIGAWREVDNGFPVDASGELPDGTTFYGTQELSGVIAEDPRYATCIVEQMFTYGLGRSPTIDDGATLVALEDEFRSGGMTFEALAVAIATSPAFRNTHGEEN